MNDQSLRDALLSQDGGRSVDAELDVLNGLVQAEARRGRRLAICTLAVWVLWVAMALAFALSGTLEKAPELPAGAVPASVPTFPGPQMFVTGIFGVLLVLVGLLCLPAVVMVPLIFVFLARRSVSIGQIRVGLASIEAQLKLSSQATKVPPPGPPT
jgi:hypothetical protein